VSVLFTENGKVIWDVSSNTGKLAVAHIRAAADVVRVPPGVSDVVADEVVVDGQALSTFVQAAIAHLRQSGSQTFSALFRLPLITALGLCYRTSEDLSSFENEIEAELVADARRLVR
jgi:hypothetical protein